MWFTYALVAVLCWGGADLFYKLSSDKRDKYSALKIVMAVGLVMGLHAGYTLLFTDIEYSLAYLVDYLPISACYILSMAIGYVGMRYIEVSVISPVQNSSGAISTLLLIIFGGAVLSLWQGAAILMMCGGVIWLGILERTDAEEVALVDKKYRWSTMAFFLPVAYAIIDGLGTFADGMILGSEFATLTDDQANVSYELTFLFCAIVAIVYVYIIKKEKFTFKQTPVRYIAGGLETVGQIFYATALTLQAETAIPMIASYAIVSVILSRIFLKEKLNKWQYVAVGAVMAGIIILGILEGAEA